MPSTITYISASECTISGSGKKQLLAPTNPKCRATCVEPKWELLTDPAEPIAIDIEFQEHRPEGIAKWGHRMGRLAVVNSRGETVYDTFVHYAYKADVSTKMPPPRFGVFRKDIKLANGAKENDEVEENLKKMFAGRLVIGHGMRLDKIVVGNVWSEYHIGKDGMHGFCDTQHLYGQVALEKLVDRYLAMDEFTAHDPVHDARATMLLWLRIKGYKGRNSFEDAPFNLDPESAEYKEEYPTL